MKKTIRIDDVDKEGNNMGTPSKLSLKITGDKRKLKLRNDGGTWVEKNRPRMAIILDESERVVVRLENGDHLSMSFLDLCNMRDILTHVEDLGMTNTFGKTRVIE